MTIEEFNALDEQSKRIIIFEADKIAERNDETVKFELYAIDNFFIETKTSRQNSFKRAISTYTLNKLPLNYNNIVQSFLNDDLRKLVG